MRSPIAIVATVIAGLAVASPAHASSPPTSTGYGGAAATVDRLASKAGVDMLRKGGNATDAAVAAAAVLGVTEPFSAGIGGGGFMVSYDARRRRVTTLDHRERAPLAMHRESFLENGVPIQFEAARYSGLSVGVPGTVLGWERALRLHGTMTLREVLQPAIRVAILGFPIDQTFFEQTRENLRWFDDVPATARLFLTPNGTPRPVGTVFRNRDLANTYRLIARVGSRGFYRGRLAAAIARTVRAPQVSPTADHVWRPGVMTAADLRAYTAPERAPVRSTYRGAEIFGMGPPSSGGITVAEALNILEGYDLRGMPREEALHRIIEASRLAFADRASYIADADFVPVPQRGLLSKEYAATRRAVIGDVAGTSPAGFGDPAPFNGGAAVRAVVPSVTSTRAGTTTHISVTDRDRNVVSYTFTIEATGGSGLVVPGYGFLLNNELTDFNFTSRSHINRVQGGKRPRSSMAPTIVLRSGRPWFAVGSPGGATIINTVIGLITNRIDFGMPLPAAIAAPRFSQRDTPATAAEPGFLKTPEAAALAARGHAFSTMDEIGAATGVELLARRQVQGVAEPVRRGGGSALVQTRKPLPARRTPVRRAPARSGGGR
ncbi:MAG TPA: gamma-glutamyltransferase [Solirubrobacteraceae bacterium]|nr:gamma-glutamyltransferase [Solirubrobacteraceae bacterium]